MTAATAQLVDLLADCEVQGIRLALAEDGDGLSIDAPRDALTPDLLARLKAHKADVLALLRPATESAPPVTVAEAWSQALDLLDGDPLFSAEDLAGLRAARVAWMPDEPRPARSAEATPVRTNGCDLEGQGSELDDIGPDGWPAGCVDPDELTPCATCGTLEQWESAAGDSRGLTPGRWRCLRCDPPTTYRRLVARADQILWRPKRSSSARHAE